MGDGRKSPPPPIQPEPPPPLSPADGEGLGADGGGISPPPIRLADPPRGETTPPRPPLRLSPDPPLPLDEMRLALVVAPVAALDLPSSPASRRDPSTEDRDRGFLNPTKWYVRFEDAREVG